MQYFHSFIFAVTTVCLTSCVSQDQGRLSARDEIEAFAICEPSEQSAKFETKLHAEYGFKRFAKNTYRPVVEQRLFGHKVRIIELAEDVNKVYAAGEPLEFAYDLKYLLPKITCEKNTCQAPLPNGQSLLVYKAEFKKAKDTTVLECTKPVNP